MYLKLHGLYENARHLLIIKYWWPIHNIALVSQTEIENVT